MEAVKVATNVTSGSSVHLRGTPCGSRLDIHDRGTALVGSGFQLQFVVAQVIILMTLISFDEQEESAPSASLLLDRVSNHREKEADMRGVGTGEEVIRFKSSPAAAAWELEPIGLARNGGEFTNEQVVVIRSR